MNNTVIEIKNVTKKFYKTTVLSNINLSVKKGELIGIVGQNGSGKSVLYKLICGLMLPTEGQIRVNNKNIGNGSFAEDIGIMLDNTGFLENETGFHNLKYIASIQNIIDCTQIKEYMELVGLNSEEKKPVKKYSLGMKQRLRFAMAIMEDPGLLLLDEPFNAIDKEMNEAMKAILMDYKKMGKTILITSHNQEDIDILCSRVIKLEAGGLYEIMAGITL